MTLVVDRGGGIRCSMFNSCVSLVFSIVLSPVSAVCPRCFFIRRSRGYRCRADNNL
jgi:hypothetical protein